MATEVKVIEKYTDPSAEVVLKSNEGREFRVRGYYLQAASVFFRDLLEQPNFDGGDKQPVPIDATSAELELYLDYVTNVEIVDEPVWSTYKRVIALSDFLDSSIITGRMITQLGPIVARAPWEIFVVAAHHSNLPIATSAIQYFGTDVSVRNVTHQKFDYQRASELPLRYLLGLIQSGAKYGNLRIWSEGDPDYSNWDEIGARFELGQ